jgi:hypothetical protein
MTALLADMLAMLTLVGAQLLQGSGSTLAGSPARAGPVDQRFVREQAKQPAARASRSTLPTGDRVDRAESCHSRATRREARIPSGFLAPARRRRRPEVWLQPQLELVSCGKVNRRTGAEETDLYGNCRGRAAHSQAWQFAHAKIKQLLAVQ